MPDIFLSYRKETGVECCSILQKSLEEDGYSVFFDFHSMRQGDFEQQIDKAISDCSFMLVVLAPHDLDRCFEAPEKDWIVHEVTIAMGDNKRRIIPVSFKQHFEFPKKCETIAALKYLSKQQICDVSGPDFANLIKTKLYMFMKESPVNQMREEYQLGIKNKEYRSWETESLQNIYFDFDFVYEFGKYHSSIVFDGSPSVKYPFTSMTELCNLREVGTPIDYRNNPYYQDYNRIVRQDIHFPNLYGFTNVGLLFDNNGCIIGFKAKPRTYNETVFSSHILQYELWKAYKTLEGKKLAKLDDLPLRKVYHKDKTNREVICSGCGRSSLSNVCLAILAYDCEYEDYQIATARRSTNVAVYPGFTNIIPSGGFELYELEDKQTSSILRKNFSLVAAIYREYIEEIFGDENFDHPTGDDDIKRLYRNEHIKQLREKIGQSYFFEFLGVSYDMISLRPVFSFVLKIDDKNYLYENDIKSNSENRNIQFVPISEFEKEITERDNTSPVIAQSAGIYTLLKRNHLYHDALMRKASASN